MDRGALDPRRTSRAREEESMARDRGAVAGGTYVPRARARASTELLPPFITVTFLRVSNTYVICRPPCYPTGDFYLPDTILSLSGKGAGDERAKAFSPAR